MSVTIAQIQRALKERGTIGTLSIILVRIGSLVRRQAFFVLETIFDCWHDVDTRGVIRLRDLGIDDPALEHAANYGGTHPGLFRRLLNSLDIDYSRYVFVDLGSGKGKALLLASEFSFESVIGIELLPTLNRTAVENLSRARRFNRRCTRIEIVTGSAVAFSFPHRPLVVYLYNPFDGVVLEQVLAALALPAQNAPLASYVVYYAPYQRKVIENIPWLEVVSTFHKCIIYRSC
jgi:SAM-dependent methyltransferase